MPLADYDTSVEKIAAYKAALIDPALIQIATSNFTTNDNIYTINRDYQINAYSTAYEHDNHLSVTGRIANNTALTGINTLLYINDSDIVYPDPITTYQDRLAMIIESDIQVMRSYTPTDAGTYGSMILEVSEGYVIEINNESTRCSTEYTTIPFQIVVPFGNNFRASIGKNLEYIDLPSDW